VQPRYPCIFWEHQRMARMMKIILFICTGNLCRSPMAEVLMNGRLAGAGVSGVRARSAGTWTAEGAPPPAHTVQVMAERGLDVQGYRAHNVTEADMAAASLVLTMTLMALLWLPIARRLTSLRRSWNRAMSASWPTSRRSILAVSLQKVGVSRRRRFLGRPKIEMQAGHISHLPVY